MSGEYLVNMFLQFHPHFCNSGGEIKDCIQEERPQVQASCLVITLQDAVQS
jgi:hypothetical protein